MDLFNNREIAILIWSALLIGWALTKESIRQAFAGFVRTAFTKPLVKVYAAMGLYVVIIVYILHAFGLWDISQLKPTIIWAFSIALISALRAHKINDDPDYFKRAVRDNINLVIILEFILGVYTFPLLGELVLVPITTFLGAVKVFAEGKEEHRPVAKLLDGLFFLFGVVVLGYAAYKLWVGFSEFATMQTFRDFYTPPLLSISFLPFLFVLSVFLAYERAFANLKRNTGDTSVYRFARAHAIRTFRCRARHLERWAHTTFLNRLNSEQQIRESIADFRALIAEQASPKEVPSDQGWSPQMAKDFMAEYGLTTRYYSKLYDDEWFASSNYLELGDGILSNNVAYYVSGSRSAVTSLKLKLNVNEPDQGDIAVSRFVELAEALLEKALSAGVSTNLHELIGGGENAETEIAGKIVSVSRDDWHGGKTGQYDVALEVCVRSAEGTPPESDGGH